ncbi:MAG: glycosyltransferase family 2 protein [Terriglobia bacterium]|jgi:cellulose synthase/poly-beta-1,6-N-acetylglucosamine synthase-like glycosyltransferase
MSGIAVVGAEFAFWVFLFPVVAAYILYPVLLFIAYALSQALRDYRYLLTRQERRARLLGREELPPISLLIAAYNEERYLVDRIANLQQLDYPREKLEVVIVSDGSTDRTNEILQSVGHPNLRVILLPDRKGKSNALNCAVKQAQHDILVFSDANTFFEPEALRYLVRHFIDSRVGVVCGAQNFRRTAESQRTEGLFWKFESMLRLMEARLNATLTASGAIYAVRRQCFAPLATDTILDDFVIPMRARKRGYRVVYDPEAVAVEVAPASVEGEFTRRVRLAVGSFRALGEFIGVPLTGFSWLAFLCHKLLRWIVPFALIGLFVSNSLLLSRPVYRIPFVGQLLVYTWACLGFAFRNSLRKVRYWRLGSFLLGMNVAFLVGFVRFLVGREKGTWQQVR